MCTRWLSSGTESISGAFGGSAGLVRVRNVGKRVVWFGRHLDADGVARSNHSSGEYDCHGASDTNDVPFAVPVAQQFHEPVLELVDLDARIAETSQLDRCVRAECRIEPAGSESMSMPRVVTFSSSWSAATSWP
jgi:hypothetical protein